MDKLLSFVIGSISSILFFAFGVENLGMLKILLFLIVVDIVFGVAVSVNNKSFSQRILYTGISMKIGEIFLISIAYQIDKIGLLGGQVDAQYIAICGYLVYEIYSIFVKAKKLNIFIPNTIVQYVDKINDAAIEKLPVPNPIPEENKEGENIGK